MKSGQACLAGRLGTCDILSASIEKHSHSTGGSTGGRSSHRRCSVNFIKKETLTQVFSCKLFELFKNTFFKEHLRTTASVVGRVPTIILELNFWTFKDI